MELDFNSFYPILQQMVERHNKSKDSIERYIVLLAIVNQLDKTANGLKLNFVKMYEEAAIRQATKKE